MVEERERVGLFFSRHRKKIIFAKSPAFSSLSPPIGSEKRGRETPGGDNYNRIKFSSKRRDFPRD